MEKETGVIVVIDYQKIFLVFGLLLTGVWALGIANVFFRHFQKWKKWKVEEIKEGRWLL